MNKHLCSRLIFSIMVPILLIGHSAPSAAASAPASISPDIRVLASDSTGLTVELTVPTLSLELAASDQGACLHATVPTWVASGRAGEPALPVLGMLIGLPTGESASVELITADPSFDREDINLCPSPTILVNQSMNGSLMTSDEALVINPEAYKTDRFLPGALAEVSKPERLRGQWVARLILQPFQYNPAAHQLSAYTRLKVRVTFASSPTYNLQNVEPTDSLFSGLLLNENAARAWRTVPRSIPLSNKAAFVPSSGESIKIAVSKDGLVQVDYAALQGAGAPVDTLDPNTFRISSSEGESDLTLKANGDSVFEPGESIIFYGNKVNTRYTDTNIYWLTWGNSVGPSISEVDATPTTGTTPSTYISTVHFEENKSYQSKLVSGLNDDHWYWGNIYATAPASVTYTVQLPNVAMIGGNAKIRGLLKGISANPQHHTHVYLNGSLLREDSWAAQGELAFENIISQSMLLEGPNEIKVECPLTDGVKLDVVLINWFEIEYTKTYTAEEPWTQFEVDSAGDWLLAVNNITEVDAQVWDITDPLHPLHLLNPALQSDGTSYTLTFHQITDSSRRYIAGSPTMLFSADSLTLTSLVDLHATSNTADYLLITHPDFLTAVQPLADFHASQGLRVKIINVNDIYDNFSGGVFDPLAIRDFIAYAYSNWQTPKPAYVLLVGDGNYDFKNYFELNDSNYIPPYMSMADPWIGEVAADNRYVAVDGDDPLPDLALGRLPVRSAAEAIGVVNKILSYATVSQRGNWGRSFLLVSDISDPAAGNFPALSDQLAADMLTPRGLDTYKISYTITHSTAAATREAIINSINAGKGIIIYAGHSSPIQWSKANILVASDLNSMVNTSTTPFLISLTCYTGMYYVPNNDLSGFSSLDEQLFREPAKGMVATFSPTGQGLAEGHDILARGLLDTIFNHNEQIGPATTIAKVYLYGASAMHHELIDTYVLFGDPALVVPIKRNTYLPLINR